MAYCVKVHLSREKGLICIDGMTYNDVSSFLDVGITPFDNYVEQSSGEESALGEFSNAYQNDQPKPAPSSSPPMPSNTEA